MVLPELFSGETSWDSWLVDVNEWSNQQKLKWLKVWHTGKAQTAFQRLPEVLKASFGVVKKALQERFELKSRQSCYQAEFQTRTKHKSETWADFANDLKNLVNNKSIQQSWIRW